MSNYFTLEVEYLDLKPHDHFQHSASKNNVHRVRYNSSLINVQIVNKEDTLEIKMISAIFSREFEYKKLMGFLYNEIIPLYK